MNKVNTSVALDFGNICGPATRLAFFLTGLLLVRGPVEAVEIVGGWGIDAAWGSVPDIKTADALLPAISKSGVRWIRGRGVPWPMSAEFNSSADKLSAAGMFLSAFGQPLGLVADQGRALPSDLLAVYWRARELAEAYSGRIRAWEIEGEPDVGYCRALPDEYVAYEKAMYLGMRDGNPRCLILMGALALPPGPWLSRAKENGLLQYTDAFNFHFYGRASDFRGMLDIQNEAAGNSLSSGGRAAIADDVPARRSKLPLWISECGFNTLVSGSTSNSDRRRMQAEFFIDLTHIAAADRRITVFMPFVLYHERDPFSMMGAPEVSFPAWEAYKAATNSLRLERKISDQTQPPNRVVLQWSADQTVLSHKVSGTYRSRDPSGPISGTITINNFDAVQVSGTLSIQVGGGTPESVEQRTVQISAFGRIRIPASFHLSGRGYRRQPILARFRASSSQTTTLKFYIDRALDETKGRVVPMAFQPALTRDSIFHYFETDRLSCSTPHWVTLNGLALSEDAQVGDGSRVVITPQEGAIDDPIKPPLAIAGVSGLPPDGFIHLRLARPMSQNFGVRCDLVDQRGRRFCIWENFGADYFSASRDVWLNLSDFNLYYWGTASGSPNLVPSEVRQIQLRPYFFKDTESQPIEISFWRPFDE